MVQVATSQRLLSAAFAVAALSLTTTGCGFMSTSPEEALQELQARPSFEQGSADYLALLMEARGVIEDLAPNVKWNADKASRMGASLCGQPFTNIENTRSATYDAGSGIGAIPDDVWPEVKSKVASIAKQYGFTEGGSLKDEPGNTMFVIRDRYGASLELGYVNNTTMAIYGSCMLLEG